jgi:hypothetical protein
MTGRSEQARALYSILKGQFGDAIGTTCFRSGRGTLRNVFIVGVQRQLNEGELKNFPAQYEGCSIILERQKPARAFN